MPETCIHTDALAYAEAQLLDLCREPDRLSAPGDAGSLGRMAVHIRNINRSMRDTAGDHVNAAKRLTDFSLMLKRLARNLQPDTHELAQRMQTVADMLKSTGAELARRHAVAQPVIPG